MTGIDAERIIWSKAQEEHEASGGVWCNLTFDEQLELYCRQRDKIGLRVKVMGHDVLQTELIQKMNDVLDEVDQKTMKAEPRVWVVMSHDDQSDYSEGRYYSCAQDTTEIIAIYDNEDAAQDIASKLEREEAERQSLDDYDECSDGKRYFSVKPVPVQHEPRWSELDLDYDIRDDR